MFLVVIKSIGQTYGDKKYYLVDSLDLEKVSSYDKKLIDSSLALYHNTEQDTSKIKAISIIVEEAFSLNVWPKYNHWLYTFVKNKLEDEKGNINTINPEMIFFLLESYARTINNKGILYFDRGDFPKALTYYFLSLEIREEIDDKKGIAESFYNLGIAYNDQENFNQSLNYYIKSLELYELFNDKASMGNLFNNIGDIYLQQENTVLALEYFHKSLVINTSINYQRGIATVLRNIGLIYSKQGKYKVALENYNKSLLIESDIGNDTGRISSLIRIGQLYLVLNKVYTAKKYAKKSMSIAQKIGYPTEIMNSANLLDSIYQKESNWKKAYEMNSIYVKMKDSLHNNDTERELSKQQANYEIEKKEQQIVLLSSQNEVQELKLNRNKILITLFSIGFGLALILVVVVYKVYKKNQVINKMISKKSEERKTMLQEIHHRVKNNLQVVNSLLRMQSKKSSDKEFIDAFKQTQSRVLSMAKLHEKMYQSGDLKRLNAKEHITILVEEIVKNYTVEKEIVLNLDIEEFFIDAQTMMPLSLIINEMISNSLKYAFEGREKGTITVKFNSASPTTNELYIADDGVGFTSEKAPIGLGSKLIQSFTRQLNGTIEKIAVNGTAFKLTFEDVISK